MKTSHDTLGLVLLIGIPVLLFAMWRIGDFVPAVLFLVAGAIVILMVHYLHHLSWMVVATPLILPVAYKIFRGDRRGRTGNFRRKRER